MTLPQGAVLFDYDDTLVQTRQCKYEAIITLAQRHYDASISPADIDRHWGIEYSALFRNLFSGIDPDVGRVIRRYEELNDEFPIVAYSDTVASLEALLDNGYLVGVVTSAGNIVHAQMRSAGIPVARLKMVQTANDTVFHKPDPRVFDPARELFRNVGLDEARITYVGDSLSDFRAATNAGLRFVGVYGRTTAKQDFDDVSARSVASLRALVEEEFHV